MRVSNCQNEFQKKKQSKMENRLLTEQELKQLFESDSINAHPDPSVGERVKYAFLVQSSKYKVVQNSFSGAFGWFFSLSDLPVKAALVSMVLLLSILNFPPAGNRALAPLADTTQSTLPLNVDSAAILPFFADTCILSNFYDTYSNKNAGPAYSFEDNMELINQTYELILSLPNDKIRSVSFPVPSFYRETKPLQKQQTIGSNNTSPSESPFVA